MKSTLKMLPIVAGLAFAASYCASRANQQPFDQFDPLSGTCAIQPSQGLSLFVTNPTVMANFPLETVMDQIAKTGSTTGQTGLQVYQQLLDTLNKSDGGFTSGPHCDDAVNDAGQPVINGFPIECPRKEGSLAATDPFSPDAGNVSYIPIAVVNRFDLAPRNGSNCGEYRIVYGLQSGKTNILHRTLLIFEAGLPNPNPDAGLAACLPVAQFWDNLSADDAGISDVAKQLTNFYFQGLPGFDAVVRAQNYGIGGGQNTGQIRANLFFGDEGELWQLREFRLSQKDGQLIAKNTFVRNNPFGALFAGGDTQATKFQSEFLSQVNSLASATTPPTISMSTPIADNAGQSDEQLTDNNYRLQAADAGAFLESVTDKLEALKIKDVTANNVLDRATTQACAGCHELMNGANLGGPDGGVIWPSSLGFTQENESGAISQALSQSFLPFRASVLENFINQECGGVDAGIDNNDALNVGGGQVGSAN
jgi:hypothetical protein